MNPISLLNSRYKIENINQLQLYIDSNLDDLFLSISFMAINPLTNYVIDIFDNKTNCPSYTHIVDRPNKLTSANIKKMVDWIFLKADRVFLCVDCEKAYYEESFKGDSKLFRCHSCIAQKLYYESRKENKNIIKCDLCFELTFKKKCKSNEKCCKTKDNEKFICEKCFDKLSLENNEEDDEDNELFIKCPWCRGRFQNID